MMSRKILFLLLFISSVHAAEIPFDAPPDSEAIIWTGVPIKLDISVRKDRVIRFAGSRRIQVAVPMDLQGVASAESVGGVVHFRSFEPFIERPFWFRDKDTEQIYRLDITANGTSDRRPVVIMNPIQPTDNPLSDLEVDASNLDVEADGESEQTAYFSQRDLNKTPAPQQQFDEEVVEPVQHGVIGLTRLAFQKIYAPDRLIGELDDVYQIPVDDTAYIHMVVGSEVSARPVAQWKNEDRFVTAFVLRNNSPKQVKLDPRKLRGSRYWESASLISDTLSPSNKYGDATSLVVISDKKFQEYERWLR